MRKIMIIGCPGSGKSTLTRKLHKLTNYPVLHLDRIFHIDNETYITRDELKEKVVEFVSNKESFIIDGNYGSTIEFRIQFVDTIILLDVPMEFCLSNVYKRMKEPQRDDMAPGFDNSVLDPEFIEYVKAFRTEKLPDLYNLIEGSNKQVFVLKSDTQIDEFLHNLKTTIMI